MNRLTIDSLSGLPPYNVYLADERGDNEVFLDTIISPIPPSKTFTPPNTYNKCATVMVILEDSSFYRIYKLLPCKHNCDFTIYITQNLD